MRVLALKYLGPAVFELVLCTRGGQAVKRVAWKLLVEMTCPRSSIPGLLVKHCSRVTDGSIPAAMLPTDSLVSLMGVLLWGRGAARK